MTQHWMDGFDHYGSGSEGKANALNGAWDAIDGNATLAVPAPGARTGPMCAKGDGLSSDFRRALLSAQDTVIASFATYCDTLPDDVAIHRLMMYRDVFNANICYITTRPDGALEFRDGAGTIQATTTGAVINAASWQHIEMTVTRSTGVFEIFVDEVSVLSGTLGALGANDTGIIAFNQGGGLSDPNNLYWDDIIVRDDQGIYNNGIEGDLRVATLQPVANVDAVQGWTSRPLEKLGVGILDLADKGSDAGIMYDDEPEFELGSADFCIEGFVYFDENLVTTGQTTIFSKWRESVDTRSYRLRLRGPDNGNVLEWEISTDGTAGAAVTIHSVAWIPNPKTWYHLAVARESGVNRLYIDGVRTGGDQVDANTYYNGAASLAVSGESNGANTLIANASVNGYMDGVRLTVGAARYTAQFFTPPTDVLPDNVADDTLYNSVELLLNFDGTTVLDESVNAWAVDDIEGGAVTLLPDDASAFQTIDGETPNDRDFQSGDLIAATGILTLTGQPLDTETVVLGTVTYTFLTVFVDAANNILIGADIEASLNNLRAAVNQETGEGTLYGTGTVFNPDIYMSDMDAVSEKTATARVPGTAGNTLASTETLTNGSWSAATLLGGLDLPTNSEFTVGQLPPEVTGVKAIAVVVRAYKTDSGTATLVPSFVKQDGVNAHAGGTIALPLSPTYFEDTYETDPETAGALTPSTMVSSRIRINRAS